MLLNMETVAESLTWARQELNELGLEEAITSSEILLAEVLECSRVSLQIDSKKNLDQTQAERFRHWIFLRKNRTPVAYITGRSFWMREEFYVNENCLIPRPETELLIESFSEVTGFKKEKEFSFLDLGTGSGAISISLLRLFPQTKAVLADISQEALDVARKNIKKYGLEKRAECILSDGFSQLRGRKWDVIVSNPPYVVSRDIQSLEPEVLSEPHLALDGGEDGLNFYRLLASEAKNYLAENGFLIVEVGQGQSEAVREIFAKADFASISEKKDLLNISRMVVAQRVETK